MSAELKAYKIVKIDMVNDLTGEQSLKIGQSFGFDCKFLPGQEKGVYTAADAVLTEVVKQVDKEEIFHIALVLEGIFDVGEVKTDEERVDAHIACYEGLFPVAATIIRDLMTNSGLPGFNMNMIPMDRSKIKLGKN